MLHIMLTIRLTSTSIGPAQLLSDGMDWSIEPVGLWGWYVVSRTGPASRAYAVKGYMPNLNEQQIKRRINNHNKVQNVSCTFSAMLIKHFYPSAISENTFKYKKKINFSRCIDQIEILNNHLIVDRKFILNIFIWLSYLIRGWNEPANRWSIAIRAFCSSVILALFYY